MKVKVIIVIVLVALFSCKPKTKSRAVEKYTFLVGTYTSNEEEGINKVAYYPQKDTLVIEDVIVGSTNPSFLVKTKKMVFGAEETGGDSGGTVSSYLVDSNSDTIKKVASVNTVGEHTCVIAHDSKNDVLLAGNYSGGNIAVLKLSKEGEFDNQPKQLIQHYGMSINSERQEKPHVHDIVFHPHNNKVFVADLGVDKVYIYDYFPHDSLVLVPSERPFIDVEKGSGPRHLAFDTSGKYMFLVHELTAEVSVWSVLNDFQLIDKISLTNSTLIDKEKSGAELKIAADGNFLYVSNRGAYNELVVFEIKKNHKLQKIQTIQSGGATPRSFVNTEDGKFLLVANQDSNSLAVFKVLKNGRLEAKNANVTINKPVHIINW